MSTTTLVVLALLLAAAAGVALLYNRLVTSQVQTENAWADIEVQLRRRHDLVPNLVETVRGYADHESETFEEVVRARQKAIDVSELGDLAEAEGELTRALRQLFALSEDYPDLRASENFRQLGRQLDEIEEALQNARRYYNATVRDYNTLVRQFPANLLAGPLGFRTREFFELEDEAARAVPEVDFS